MSVKGCTKHRRKDADGILYENSIPVTESGCWLWTDTLNHNGYGRLFFNGSMRLAHRLSYETFVRPIPEGLFICHKCDTKSCINPDHLFAGTSADNMADMASKGRSVNQKKTKCIHGHLFDEINTIIGPHGWRYCKTCMRGHQKNYKIKMKLTSALPENAE